MDSNQRVLRTSFHLYPAVRLLVLSPHFCELLKAGCPEKARFSLEDSIRIKSLRNMKMRHASAGFVCTELFSPLVLNAACRPRINHSTTPPQVEADLDALQQTSSGSHIII